MSNGKITLQYNDYDGERSTVNVPCDVLTSTGFTQFEIDVTALRTAISDISLGLAVGYKYGNEYQLLPAGQQSTNPLSQRELKWKVNCEDVVEMKPWHFTIPAPDLTHLDEANRGFADLTGTDMAAFVTAAETVVKSPYGNDCHIVSVELVGRNI